MLYKKSVSDYTALQRIVCFVNKDSVRKNKSVEEVKSEDLKINGRFLVFLE